MYDALKLIFESQKCLCKYLEYVGQTALQNLQNRCLAR